ncbi:DUF554 domain-containing protein [Salidesulfovibrio onnuriiensis]|uniref:DUF554 domain-containing protein n=1 Tax=Salidesulfovibrio onnuriiensis TaxID=2583823 RepID=UPI0011CA3844|nr:DUF554 domain-containing protein [Salidesulfovibrio onnuriiensis]
MLPVGSLANAAAIILGSLAGCLLHSRFPERIRVIVFQGLGLCTLLIGLQMAFKVQNILVVIFSILLGGITGELLRLDTLFERLGNRFKTAVKSENPKFTEGLITASLIYCIGAMAIVGSLEEGVTGDPTVLYTKAILDGFASVALASTFGSGVLFSFIPVLLYQGALTLFAGFFQQYFSPELIAQLSATGGLLIVGISITLLDIKEIRLSNLLPALPFVVALVPLADWLQTLF